MQEGIASGEIPQIGVLVDDPDLNQWLCATLAQAFHLRCGEPGSAELAASVVYLIDPPALRRHEAWLRSARASLAPDSSPVLLLVQGAEAATAEELALVDARLSTSLSGPAFCDQLMHT